MAVKIKLKRLGKIRAPYYRVVVADARAKRDGRAIEEIGKYHPKQEPSLIEINSERAQYWLSVGAQPTDPVRNLLKITGDWQRFRGEDGADGTLKMAAPQPGKQEAFAAALKEAHGEAEGAATTTKERGRRADAKSEKADGKSAKAPRSSRTASGTDKAGAEGKQEKSASKATAAPEKAGAEEAGKAADEEQAAPKDEAEDGETEDGETEDGETEDGETGKAGTRAGRKRSSGSKAEATSGGSDKAGTDEAGSEG